jgi:anti-sigma regulatory factor (Ser/Thr protein kinase)
LFNLQKYFEKFREYHFEFKHLTVLFIILLSFQIIVSFVNKSSITTFLSNTKNWYQEDAVEKLANLTATSLELIMESFDIQNEITKEEKSRIIQSFNIIFSQQFLQHNIEELCIFMSRRDTLYAIDEGKTFFAFLNDEIIEMENPTGHNSAATTLFESLDEKLRSEEQIKSIPDSGNTLHVFVPFVIKGEYVGAVYMKNTPDFSLISDQLIARHDETTIIYVSLILLGFILMYFISSYTVKERDEAQRKFFIEHDQNLKKQITHEKEIAFTKRIYHTHHKAEKIMGFIKEDLNQLDEENIKKINYRVTKYSNFISRVIYDMKWFDPPVQTIRGAMYKTNLNEVLKFLVDNIFLRVSRISDAFRFNLNFDKKLPEVNVNEFVIWELFEPLIQNCIEHSGAGQIEVTIETSYNELNNEISIFISDNGKGIKPDLLEKNDKGIAKIFMENISTKNSDLQDEGYGCFIAYQISRRCGWEIDVTNNLNGGCTYKITILNTQRIDKNAY